MTNLSIVSTGWPRPWAQVVPTSSAEAPPLFSTLPSNWRPTEHYGTPTAEPHRILRSSPVLGSWQRRRCLSGRAWQHRLGGPWAAGGPPPRVHPHRDAAIDVLTALTCAPITRTIRGLRSEVEVGLGEGLTEASVISCDNLITVPISVLDHEPVGNLELGSRVRLDQALRYALDIQY